MYFPAIELSGKLISKCKKLGFDVRYSNDFKFLKECSHTIGAPVTPHFDVDKGDLLRADTFWLGAFKKNRCAGMVACKRQTLGDETLESYIRRRWPNLYKAKENKEYSLGATQQRQLRQVTGNLIYNGEFRVLEKYRKTGLGMALWGVARIVSFTKWPETNWSYLFGRQTDWHDGFMAKIQMPIQVQSAINWNAAPTPEVNDYVLGLMSEAAYRDWVDGQHRRKAWQIDNN